MTDWLKKYPHNIYASVVLLDKKIINWKVAKYAWNGVNWMRSKQPQIASSDHGAIEVISVCFVANNREEHEEIFSVDAKEFFKQFLIHPRFDLQSPY